VRSVAFGSKWRTAGSPTCAPPRGSGQCRLETDIAVRRTAVRVPDKVTVTFGDDHTLPDRASSQLPVGRGPRQIQRRDHLWNPLLVGRAPGGELNRRDGRSIRRGRQAHGQRHYTRVAGGGKQDLDRPLKECRRHRRAFIRRHGTGSTEKLPPSSGRAWHANQANLLRDHVALTCRSVDRIFLRLVTPRYARRARDLCRRPR
jgi:hypothetical protein